MICILVYTYHMNIVFHRCGRACADSNCTCEWRLSNKFRRRVFLADLLFYAVDGTNGCTEMIIIILENQLNYNWNGSHVPIPWMYRVAFHFFRHNWQCVTRFRFVHVFLKVSPTKVEFILEFAKLFCWTEYELQFRFFHKFACADVTGEILFARMDQSVLLQIEIAIENLRTYFTNVSFHRRRAFVIPNEWTEMKWKYSAFLKFYIIFKMPYMEWSTEFSFVSINTILLRFSSLLFRSFRWRHDLETEWCNNYLLFF